jgi:tetratricopeptide (TPR) repeat protein
MTAGNPPQEGHEVSPLTQTKGVLRTGELIEDVPVEEEERGGFGIKSVPDRSSGGLLLWVTLFMSALAVIGVVVLGVALWPRNAPPPSPSPDAAMPSGKAGPAVADTMTKPAVADTTTKPAVADTTTKPAVADTTTKPAVADTTTKTAVADATTKPAVADATTKPAVADTTTKPAVADATTKPAVADATTKPAVADATTKPAVADTTTKPAVTPGSEGSQSLAEIVKTGKIESASAVLKQVESKDLTDAEIDQIKKWLGKVQSSANTPEERRLIRRIRVSVDFSVPEPVASPPSAGVPASEKQTGRASLAVPVAATRERFAGISLLALRFCPSLARLNAMYLADADPAQPPKGLSGDDIQQWNDAVAALQEAEKENSWVGCAHEAYQLAALCRKCGETDRALDLCTRGIEYANKANIAALNRRRLAFLDLRQHLLLDKTKAAIRMAKAADDKADKAPQPVVADNRILLAGLRKALQALSPADSEGKKRLEKALSEIDTLERAPDKVTFVQFVEQSLRLHRLVYDFASLREGGPPKPEPSLMTKASVDHFLQNLRLPERLEALKPPEQAPPTIAEGQHERHQKLWDDLSSSCSTLRSRLDKLKPDAAIPSEQAAETFEQMNRILSAVTQLESAQLVAGIKVPPPPPPPFDPAHQKAVQRVPDSDLAHVNRQLQALQDLFQQNLASFEADVKRVQANTEQNRAGVARSQAAVAQLDRRGEERHQAALAVTRQAEQRLAQGVTELGARLGQDRERTAEQLQTLRKRLQDEIQVALAKPRAMPPDQLQALSQEVVGKLLGELAGYGYTPPTGAAGATAAPRVEPLAEQPDPIMAKELYGVGREAFFAPGRLKEATEHFARAARLDPKNPVYRYYLGLALYQSGRVLEGTAQVQAGKKMEAQYGRSEVRGSLERIQGPTRAWLEDIRLRS